jgi:hypothetical protein
VKKGPRVFGQHVSLGVGSCRQDVFVMAPGENPTGAWSDLINVMYMPGGVRVAHSPMGTFHYSVEGKDEVADALITLASRIRADR